jgi:hypothetical protein
VGPDDVRAHVLQVRLQSTARAASYTMRTHALSRLLKKGVSFRN